jgi:hypothetical protein
VKKKEEEENYNDHNSSIDDDNNNNKKFKEGSSDMQINEVPQIYRYSKAKASTHLHTFIHDYYQTALP